MWSLFLALTWSAVAASALFQEVTPGSILQKITPGSQKITPGSQQPIADGLNVDVSRLYFLYFNSINTYTLDWTA